MADQLHLLIRLEVVVSPKKRVMKKALAKVAVREKIDSSLEFNHVFDVEFSAPPPKESKKKPKWSPRFQELQRCLLR